MLSAIPKHLLSEPKVQRDLNPKGVKRDSRGTVGQTVKIKSTFKNPETENKVVKGIFI